MQVGGGPGSRGGYAPSGLPGAPGRGAGGAARALEAAAGPSGRPPSRPPTPVLSPAGTAEPRAAPGCERLQEPPSPREAEAGLSDSDCKEPPEERLDGPPKAPGASPLGPCPGGRGPGPEEPPPFRPPSAAAGPPHVAEPHPLPPAAASVIHSPQQAALAKPKLWSLAEIATSADRAREAGGETAAPGPAVLGGGGPPRPSPPRPRSPPAQCPFPNGAVLPRPLYYTAPFYPGYTNYGSFGALHGHPAGGPAAPGAAFNGLNQTVLSRAEGLGKEPKAARSQPQAELGKDSPYELKKGMSSI